MQPGKPYLCPLGVRGGGLEVPPEMFEHFCPIFHASAIEIAWSTVLFKHLINMSVKSMLHFWLVIKVVGGT